MIDPDQFLKHAENMILPRNSPQEVEFRSAVSRAYYSLFHEAFDKISQTHREMLTKTICDYLDKEYVIYDKKRIASLDRDYIKNQRINMHQTIPLVLKKINKRNEGYDFEGFRNDRNDSDYDIHNEYSKNDAKTKVAQIKKLIQKIKQIQK